MNNFYAINLKILTVSRINRLLFSILFLTFLSLTTVAQTLLVNYDFGSSNTACSSTPVTASGITSTLSTSLSCIGTRAGVAVSTPTSFATNSTAGNCMAMRSPTGGGFLNDYFQFSLGGSQLNQYGGYKIFFNCKLDNSVGVLTIDYSINGTTWTNFSTLTPAANTWVGITQDLTAVSALNLQSNVYFRIGIPSNSGGSNKFADIDNFQVYSGCNPAQLSLPATLTQCNGTIATMSVTVASGTAPFTYQWLKNGSAIAGANSASYTMNSLVLADSGNYSVTVSNCTSVNSSTLKLTVNPSPTITISATAAGVCFRSSAQSSTLAYSATTNSPTNYTITWNAAALAAGLVNVNSTALPATPITFNIEANVAAGTYTGIVALTNAKGCSSSSGASFTVTVNPLPAITT